jgi:hypothetical protein
LILEKAVAGLVMHEGQGVATPCPFCGIHPQGDWLSCATGSLMPTLLRNLGSTAFSRLIATWYETLKGWAFPPLPGLTTAAKKESEDA